VTEFKYLNAGNSQAQDMLGTSFLFGQTSPGIAATGVLSGLQVAQTATASGSVLIPVGAAAVQASLTAGVSELVNDTSKTLNVLTANPVGALPRNDVIAFNSVTSALEVVVGSANATPTDPTVASTSIRLARIRNAANATTIPTSAIDDLRVFTSLAGAVTPVASAAERAALVQWNGRVISRTDTDVLEQSDGSSWSQITPGVWQSFSPFLYQNMSTTPAVIAATVEYARWRYLDVHTVQAQVSVARQTGVTTAGGLGVALPVTAAFRSFNCGTLVVVGASAPSTQTGIAYMFTDLAKLVPVAFTSSYIDVAPSQTIRYNVTYEV